MVQFDSSEEESSKVSEQQRTKKRRAAVSKLCGGTDRSFCVDDRSKKRFICFQL